MKKIKLTQKTLERLEKGRDMDANEIVYLIRSSGSIMFSWGAESWTNVGGRGLAFRVNGLIFKGTVAITLNAMDYFDIDFIDMKGKLKKSVTDVFVGDLIEILDNNIENTENYQEDLKNLQKAYHG